MGKPGGWCVFPRHEVFSVRLKFRKDICEQFGVGQIRIPHILTRFRHGCHICWHSWQAGWKMRFFLHPLDYQRLNGWWCGPDPLMLCVVGLEVLRWGAPIYTLYNHPFVIAGSNAIAIRTIQASWVTHLLVKSIAITRFTFLTFQFVGEVEIPQIPRLTVILDPFEGSTRKVSMPGIPAPPKLPRDKNLISRYCNRNWIKSRHQGWKHLGLQMFGVSILWRWARLNGRQVAVPVGGVLVRHHRVMSGCLQGAVLKDFLLPRVDHPVLY